jgi:hypothetical protein
MYKDTGYLKREATKIPEKIQLLEFISEAQLCHEHKISTTMNNTFFVKKELSKRAQKVLCNILLLSFESVPNKTHIRTVSVLAGPGLALRLGHAEAQGPGQGPCRPLTHYCMALLQVVLQLISPHMSVCLLCCYNQLQETVKYDFRVVLNGTMSIPNFIQIHPEILKLNHADR